jgi:hypothetical protein
MYFKANQFTKIKLLGANKLSGYYDSQKGGFYDLGTNTTENTDFVLLLRFFYCLLYLFHNLIIAKQNPLATNALLSPYYHPKEKKPYKVNNKISAKPLKYMVPKRGLEPPHLAALDPKSSVSTNSTTSANLLCYIWCRRGDSNSHKRSLTCP